MYDYNTSRQQMQLPEYGRNVLKMVQHVLTIEDKAERSRAAKEIVNVMGVLNPSLRDIGDFKHKLWDHLVLMADYQLDIEAPYELPQARRATEKPRPIKYPETEIRFKHYGRNVEALIETACEMEDGDIKNQLIKMIANNMKKSYLTWNREAVTDKLIFHDMAILSGNRLIAPEDMKLTDVKELLLQIQPPSAPKKKQNQQQQRKRR